MKKKVSKKIHIGCGKRNFGENWMHIDGGDFEHVDSNDIFLTEYPSKTADLIYASHLIEYLDREEVQILLKEWYIALKDGGILRIAVPDFEAICSLYTSGKFKLSSFLGPLYGKIKMGKDFVYHKTVYDFESLEEILKNIGFKNIRRYDWKKTEHSCFDDHSQAYLPHMDKENGKLISLNVEGEK